MEGLEHMIAPKHPKNLLFKETAEGTREGFCDFQQSAATKSLIILNVISWIKCWIKCHQCNVVWCCCLQQIGLIQLTKKS